MALVGLFLSMRFVMGLIMELIMGVITGVIMGMLVARVLMFAMVQPLRFRAARVVAEHQRLYRDRHRIGRHADAA
jgi:hypothetical protein